MWTPKIKQQKPTQRGVINSFGFFSEPARKTSVILVTDKQPFKIQVGTVSKTLLFTKPRDIVSGSRKPNYIKNTEIET